MKSPQQRAFLFVSYAIEYVDGPAPQLILKLAFVQHTLGQIAFAAGDLQIGQAGRPTSSFGYDMVQVDLLAH
jgi:hypothetical protein